MAQTSQLKVEAVPEEVGSSSVKVKKEDIVEIDESDDAADDSDGNKTGENIKKGEKKQGDSKTINRPPKPQRPFTEYNVFFQLEREYILQYMGGGFASYAEEDEHDKDAQDRPPRYQHLIMPTEWYIVGKAKARKQRRSQLASNKSGKITFLQLTKMISSSWASADAETKKYCKSIALKELERYRRDMKSYIDKYGQPEKQKRRKKKPRKLAINTLNDLEGINGLSKINDINDFSGQAILNPDKFNNGFEKQSDMAMMMPGMICQSTYDDLTEPFPLGSLVDLGSSGLSIFPSASSSLSVESSCNNSKRNDELILSDFLNPSKNGTSGSPNGNKSGDGVFSLYEPSVQDDAAATIDQQVDFFLQSMEHDPKCEPAKDAPASFTGDEAINQPQLCRDVASKIPICRSISDGNHSNSEMTRSKSARTRCGSMNTALFDQQFQDRDMMSLFGMMARKRGDDYDNKNNTRFRPDYVNPASSENSYRGEGYENLFDQPHFRPMRSSYSDTGLSFTTRHSNYQFDDDLNHHNASIKGQESFVGHLADDSMERHQMYKQELRRLAAAAAKAASARDSLTSSMSNWIRDNSFIMDKW